MRESARSIFNFVKVARTVFLLFVLMLLLPLAADAQQPIPGIKQTPQWKNMNNYVVFLQSRQSTPATSAQKQVFTNNLTSKQLAANNRVKALYSRAIQRIVNRDQRAEKKQIRKVRRSQKAQIKELHAQRAKALLAESLRFASKSASINARFSGQINSAKKTLQKLQKSLSKTNNPFRREILLSHIDTVKTNISQLRGRLQSQLQKAKEASRQKTAALRRSFAIRADSTRARYQRLVDRVQSAWKKIYRNGVRSAKERRQGQFQLVRNLRQRGVGFIAAMPLAP